MHHALKEKAKDRGTIKRNVTVFTIYNTVDHDMCQSPFFSIRFLSPLCGAIWGYCLRFLKNRLKNRNVTILRVCRPGRNYSI